MAHRRVYHGNHRLGARTVDKTRLAIIVGMGLLTYLIRVIPQVFLVGRSFPEAFDRYLRYLAYAFITSIISTSLFLSGPRFDTGAAPYRALALVAAIVIALWSRSTVIGMLSGTLVTLGLSWLS